MAAHLADLKAARGCGYQTVYVERGGEEGWGAGEVEEARREGWVDMWVGAGEDGFREVARRFGILDVVGDGDGEGEGEGGGGDKGVSSDGAK